MENMQNLAKKTLFLCFSGMSCFSNFIFEVRYPDRVKIYLDICDISADISVLFSLPL